MRCLFAILFIVATLLSAFSRTGMTCGADCDDAAPQAALHQHTGETEDAPCDSSGHCNCACHGGAPLAAEVSALSVAVTPVVLTPLSLPAEFPPDAMPVGIDHPPQLA